MSTIKMLLTQTHPIERHIRQRLLTEILEKNASFLIAHDDYQLTQIEQVNYDKALTLLAAGKPYAYVVGHQAFWKLEFLVNEHTLIPRPDTELLIETILNRYKNSLSENIKLLDLGTGSGCIAISLAHECPSWDITAVDISQEAIVVANQNAMKHQIKNLQCLQGSWFTPLLTSPKFDIIVSNPPYIDPQDKHLDDLTDEPITALAADEYGLADLRYIIENASHYLKSGGLLILEHGYNQAQSVQSLFQQQGYQHIETLKDYGGNDRVTLAHLTHSINER